jgi:hypothetical protein
VLIYSSSTLFLGWWLRNIIEQILQEQLSRKHGRKAQKTLVYHTEHIADITAGVFLIYFRILPNVLDHKTPFTDYISLFGEIISALLWLYPCRITEIPTSEPSALLHH